MKICTLGFLFKGKKIILAKKKRKIGAGKWNGYGGGVEEEEDKFACLAREIKEECGVIVEKSKCDELGYIDFYFKDNQEWNQRVFIYRIDEFIGEPKETAEMGEPKEFDSDKIPYEEMLIGDEKFIPFVVQGKKFIGEIHFSEKNKELTKCVLVENFKENQEIKIK